LFKLPPNFLQYLRLVRIRRYIHILLGIIHVIVQFFISLLNIL